MPVTRSKVRRRPATDTPQKQQDIARTIEWLSTQPEEITGLVLDELVRTYPTRLIHFEMYGCSVYNIILLTQQSRSDIRWQPYDPPWPGESRGYTSKKASSHEHIYCSRKGPQLPETSTQRPTFEHTVHLVANCLLHHVLTLSKDDRGYSREYIKSILLPPLCESIVRNCTTRFAISTRKSPDTIPRFLGRYQNCLQSARVSVEFEINHKTRGLMDFQATKALACSRLLNMVKEAPSLKRLGVEIVIARDRFERRHPPATMMKAIEEEIKEIAACLANLTMSWKTISSTTSPYGSVYWNDCLQAFGVDTDDGHGSPPRNHLAVGDVLDIGARIVDRYGETFNVA